MKMLLNDEMCYGGVDSGWTTIFADTTLIERVKEIADGGEMGRTSADVIRAYKTSIGRYNETGDSEDLQEACSCELELRVILKTERLIQALGNP